MACNCKNRNRFIDENGTPEDMGLFDRILGTTKNVFVILFVSIMCVLLTPFVILYVIVSFAANGGQKIVFPNKILKKAVT